MQERHTHRNERKRAGRVDCDVARLEELGAGADVVAEASGAAGERGSLPGGADVDTADAVAVILLRCIMKWGAAGAIAGRGMCGCTQARHAR